MKRFLVLSIFTGFLSYVQAQVMDSVDNIILKIPASWKVDKNATFTQMTLFDKQKKSFCQLAVYQQQPASGDPRADFKKEWNDLVLVYFKTDAVINPVPMKSTKGAKYLSFGSVATNVADGKPYYVQLNMYDCGKAVQSIMMISGTRKLLQSFDSSWQSLIVAVKKNSEYSTVASTSTTNPASIDKQLLGLWGKSQSSPPQYRNGVLVNLTNNGYYKSQYDLKADGTYSLHGESWGGQINSNELILIDESGTFEIKGDQFILSPLKSKATTVDRGNGNIKKTENLAAVKRVYSWQLYHFEGINETQLVLKANKENRFDGGFASNEAFPNSFLFSKQYKPEWKWLLK